MKLTHFLLTATSALALTITTHAASITWGAPTNITPGLAGDLNVSTAGSLVGAFNFAGIATLVNSVNFQAFPLTGSTTTVGNFTLSSSFLSAVGTGIAAAPFSSLSGNYQILLGSAAGSGSPMTLTMNGLTAGQNYLFEAWVNDSRDFTSPGFTFKVDVTAGNTVTLDPNTSIVVGGVGQYLVGTFNASSASQQVEFFNSEFGVVNGFQLRQLAVVPEPGTAIFGLALCAVAGLRRRR